MSDNEFIDYSLCNPSPSNEEDLSIEQHLKPLPTSLEPHWLTGGESESVASGSSSSIHFPLGRRLNVLEPDCQPSTTLQSLGDSTVWVNDLIGSSGVFTPLASDVIPDAPKPFDIQIPVEDTFSAGVKRYTEKVPNGSIFASEDDDFEYVLFISCNLTNYLYEHLPLVPSCIPNQTTIFPSTLQKFYRLQSNDKFLRFQRLESGLFRVLRLSLRLMFLIMRNLLQNPLGTMPVLFVLSGLSRRRLF